MASTLGELRSSKCTPLKGAENGLSVTEVQALLALLPGWAPSDDGKTISKDFAFKNYYRTMGFANAIAWMANQQDHHPDISFGYSRCRVAYSTHSVGGISLNDLICAAKIDQLSLT